MNKINIDDLRVKFSEEEQEYLSSDNLAIKLIGFLQVRQKAIDIVTKYIEIIKESNDAKLKQILPDLRHGLSVLEGGKARVVRDGLKGMEKDLKRSKRGNRPGLGLSRGFDELVFVYHNIGFKKEWQNEIMRAVDKIEDYFNNM